MPTRPCAQPNCPNPATHKGRCPTHTRTNNQTTTRAGYHIYRRAKWRHTRERTLANHPICQACNTRLAEHAHHIIDLADGGDPWNQDNLAALCANCHSQETRRRQQATR